MTVAQLALLNTFGSLIGAALGAVELIVRA